MAELGIMVACKDVAAIMALVHKLEAVYGRRISIRDWYRDREGDTVLQVAILEIADASPIIPFPRRR